MPTLFRALSATPTSKKVTEDAAGSGGVRPLRDVIRPMFPPTAIALNGQALRLGKCIENVGGVAVVVDLDGPDSVVLTLVNNEMLTKADFLTWRDACQLTGSGRKASHGATWTRSPGRSMRTRQKKKNPTRG